MIRHIQRREREIAEDEGLTVLEKIHQILICLPQEMEQMDLGMPPDLKRTHYAQWEKLDTFFREEWGIVTELMEQGMAEGSIKRIHMPLFIDLYLGSLHQIYDSRATVKHQLPLGAGAVRYGHLAVRDCRRETGGVLRLCIGYI